MLSCKWRKEEISPGFFRCSSPKLLIPKTGVSLKHCESCYCRDHDATPTTVALQELTIKKKTPAQKMTECVFFGEEIPGSKKPGCGSCQKYKCELFGETDLVKCYSCKSSKMPDDLIKERGEFMKNLPPYPGFNGTGAVIMGGGKYEASAYVAIKMLRDSGWNYPIELWYRSHEETLSNRIRKLDVVVKDASQIEQRGGWASKILSIIHSSFEKVLFLDADCYPVKDIKPLIEDKLGILLFKDIPSGDSNLKWERHGLPQMNDFGVNSGQLWITKRETWKLLQLWNWIDKHAPYFYKYQYGDQDSLRVALAMTSFPAYIMDRPKIVQGCYVYDDLFVHRVRNKFGNFPDSPPGYVISNPKEIEAWSYYKDYERLDEHGEPKGEPPGWMSEKELLALSELSRGRDVLELGRFCGLSTLHLAKHAKSVTSVDLLDSSIAKQELDRCGCNPVNLITDYFSNSPPGPYNFIFLDGHHDRDSVLADCIEIQSRLAGKNSYIAFHDYGGGTVWPEVKDAVDEMAAKYGWKLFAQIDTLAFFGVF